MKNVSDGGYDLGVSHLRIGAATSVTLDNITKGWVRTNLETINTDLLTKAFFFAWRPGDFENDVGYCWLNREITATNNGNPGLMRIEFNLQAHIELGTEIVPYNTECFGGLTDEWYDGSRLPWWGLRAVGDYIICSDKSYVCTVLDATDKGAITWSNSIPGSPTPHDGRGLEVSSDNQVAYSACRTMSAVYSIDISDPTAISQLDTIGTGMSAPMGTALEGNYLYVADEVADKLFIVDVSAPGSMSIAGSITHSSMNGAIAVSIDTVNDVAFVTSYTSESVTAIDISTKTAPTYISHIDVATDGATLNGAHDIIYDSVNGLVYVAAWTDNAVSVIDVSDTSNMSEITSFGSTELDAPKQMHLDSTNNVLYVTGDHGINVYSVEDTSAPRYLNNFDYDSSDQYSGIDLADGHLYVGVQFGFVQVIELEACGCVPL